jgi:hypothetical protein
MLKLKYLLLLTLLTASALVQAEPVSEDDNTRAVAMYREAMALLLGRNETPRSPEKAAQLFLTLAQQNWIPAQHMLGNLYLKGRGVKQDDLQAYQWLSLASRNNPRLADTLASKRNQLRARLNGAQRQQADAWVAAWQPKSGLAMTSMN